MKQLCTPGRERMIHSTTMHAQDTEKRKRVERTRWEERKGRKRKVGEGEGQREGRVMDKNQKWTEKTKEGVT